MDGTGYNVSFGTQIGTLAVGSTVMLNVNGAAREFIIVHQGKPSSIYDDSCDGTWLVMKDFYDACEWHSSNVNDYENSTIHSYLNSTFLGFLDSNIQSAVKQVKIPYRKGYGYSTTVTSGSSGLPTKIFLLSGYEVGFTTSDDSGFPVDGSRLDYFTSSAKRVSYNSGIMADTWWLRSPVCAAYGGSAYAWSVNSKCNKDDEYCINRHGIRAALVLPKTALVDGNYNVIG